ncbi:MAG TPA: hypothetical protein VF407_22420, partial [Polyangiaceae bacterium]
MTAGRQCICDLGGLCVAEKVAVLLDGGFVKKRLQPRKSDPFPKSSDLVALVAKLMSHDRLKDCVLYRAFYYDAPPFEGSVMPLSGTTKISYANTSQAIANRALLDALQFEPD